MYKQLIQRKLGFLVEKSRNDRKKHLVNKRFAFFADDKRREIIVWIWIQEHKDKDQIKEFIIDKFHVSDKDAEDLFCEAYPDGLNLQEEEVLDNLDTILTELVGIQPEIVSDTFNIMQNNMPDTALERYELPTNIQNQVKIVIGALLQKRQLV